MSTLFQRKYSLYSLFVLLAGLGALIFIRLTPFMGGILGAATLFVLLRHQMYRLTEQRHWRPTWAATVLLLEAVLLFLVPFSLVVWLIVSRVQQLTLEPQELIDTAKNVAVWIHARTGYNLWQESNIQSLVAYLPKAGQWALAGIADLGVNMVVLLFILYFLLKGGRAMEKYFTEILPFNRFISVHIIHEIHLVVRSNAVGIPLLALAQGVVAYVGYLLCHAPSPLFWGVATCFSSILPVVGTAIVWFPLSLYMMLSGQLTMGLMLFAFGVLVITQVDNVVRMMLQKRMADIHPLITIFGVVIGLPVFGFMGVIFGPLLLSIFVFCVDIFKHKYLDEGEDAGLMIASDEKRTT